MIRHFQCVSSSQETDEASNQPLKHIHYNCASAVVCTGNCGTVIGNNAAVYKVI